MALVIKSTGDIFGCHLATVWDIFGISPMLNKILDENLSKRYFYFSWDSKQSRLSTMEIIQVLPA